MKHLIDTKLNVNRIIMLLWAFAIIVSHIHTPVVVFWAWIMSIFVLSLFENKGRFDVKWFMMAVLLLAYFIINYLYRAGDTTEAQTEVVNLSVMSLLLLGASFRKKGEPLRVVHVLYYSTAFFSCLALLNHFYLWNPFGLMNESIADRLYGGFSGPNELANFLVVVLAYAFLYHRMIARIRGLYLLAIPIVTALVLTWSRAGFIFLGVAVGIILIVVLFQLIKNKKYYSLLLFGLITAGVVCLAVFILAPQLRLHREGSGDRDYLMEYTFKLLQEKPIFGHGTGFMSYQDAVSNETPHNEYFLFAINGGIIGLVALIGLFALVLVSAYRKKLYPEMITLLIFYFVEMSFNNLVRRRVSVLFWMLAYLVIVTKYPDRPLKDREGAR